MRVEKKKVSSNGINVSSSQDHSSYYSINGGQVDLINQLPARASPFLCMTEATSMVKTSNGNTEWTELGKCA